MTAEFREEEKALAEQQNLTENENAASIPDQQDASAAGEAAEDTLEAYKELFEKQQAAVAKAEQQVKSLQDQISILMRNGASVTSGQQQQQQTAASPKDDDAYVSMNDLGREIGKRN